MFDAALELPLIVCSSQLLMAVLGCILGVQGKSLLLMLTMMSGLTKKIQTCLSMLHHEQSVSLRISLLLMQGDQYKFPSLPLIQAGASQGVGELAQRMTSC